MSSLSIELGRALSDDRVRVNQAELSLYRRDASNFDGAASVVCFPLTTEEVRAVVRLCGRFNTPWVARGSGTGLAGGATPLDGAVVISLSKMTRIISVDAESRLAWV